MKLKYFFGVFLARGALSNGVLIIDKKSCGDKYEAIKSAAQGAIDMSKQAASVYKVYVDTGAKPDDRYMAQARNLFGTDDQDTVLIAYKRLFNIENLKIEEYDIYGDEWPKVRDNKDVVIVCNTDHIEEIQDEDSNINYRNTLQDVPVADNNMILRIKSGDPSIAALTARKPRKSDLKRIKISWPAAAVEVITLNPSYLTTLEGQGFPTYNEDLVKKARFESLVNIIRNQFKIPTFDAIDTLTVGILQFTLLHEFQHLATSGWADDLDGKNSYLWYDCIRLKSVENAESMAYFTLATELINKHGFDVDEKGSLRRI